MSFDSLASGASRRWLAATCLLVAACADGRPTAPDALPPEAPRSALLAVECQGDVRTEKVSCGVPRTGGASANVVYGGQNTNVRLTSSNVTFDSERVFGFDVTVQNLLNEAIGTPDGVTPDPLGIRVFFHAGPTVTAGEGNAQLLNADGTGTFTATEQPYFQYDEILEQNEVSGAKRWQIHLDPGVVTFNFRLYVSTEVQPLLVINEVLANPGGTIPDAAGEWFELFNAGSFPVQLQGMVIADSAGGLGRGPYHAIGSSLVVAPGGYVVLGNTTSTSSNGGVPVDYAYGAALALSNSQPDRVKLARVFGTDTLVIDQVQYASPAISAKNGISRELLNPALDNVNMDGSNWADALVTAVYGPAGRGTPKAQNSTFTP